MDSQQAGIQAFTVSEKNLILENTVKKVRRKLLYFLLILFIFSFLDRINIGFVGKELSADLGLTALSFGLANTIFYIFYICFGIPSNLMLKNLVLNYGLVQSSSFGDCIKLYGICNG